MFSKFLSLEPEKKERILNAAMKEFSQKGFANASTNEIVKNANISKGMLFHYFNKKKDLFIFLYDYIMGVLTVEFFEKIDFNERDIFIKLRQIMVIKIDLSNKYPEIFKFIMTATVEESREVKDDLNRSNDELTKDNYNKIFSNIDYANFKEGIDVEKAINIIFWTIEGYSNKFMDKVKLDINEYTESFKEIDIYLEILKKTFYK